MMDQASFSGGILSNDEFKLKEKKVLIRFSSLPLELRICVSVTLKFGQQISFETKLSLEETFETITVECSGRLIQTPEHCLKE